MYPNNKITYGDFEDRNRIFGEKKNFVKCLAFSFVFCSHLKSNVKPQRKKLFFSEISAMKWLWRENLWKWVQNRKNSCKAYSFKLKECVLGQKF